MVQALAKPSNDVTNFCNSLTNVSPKTNLSLACLDPKYNSPVLITVLILESKWISLLADKWIVLFEDKINESCLAFNTNLPEFNKIWFPL